MILIETNRLLLRNVAPEDAEVMYDYRNDEICARYQLHRSEERTEHGSFEETWI